MNAADSRKAIAIIPARGGSKGLPGKNIRSFCGKPLLAWSIEQALGAKTISDVYVSSDADEILDVAVKFGAKAIRRPAGISGDKASSESAWLHAIETIEKQRPVDLVLAMQATSPLRRSADIDGAMELLHQGNYDSLLSGDNLETYFIWEQTQAKDWQSSNYDYRARPRRQDLPKRAHENGSFYLFRAAGFRSSGNRLHGRIGIFEMPTWMAAEIDTAEDFELCETLFSHYLLKKNQN